MALTVASAFDEFKSKLLLTQDQKNSVNNRKQAVDGYLRSAFPDSSDLPLSFTKLIGSASRHTIIRPLDDIDVLAKFINKDDIFERYRHDSQAFIYRVRDALNTVARVQVVGTRGQAVRFFYTNAPHVDIAPVFSWNSGGYALPDGRGGWLTTDPDKHQDYFTQRNNLVGHNLKPMIRMLKRWNNVHSGYLKSFHLEVMIANIFSNLNNDSRDACEKFFGWAQSRLSINDPAGYSGDLSLYLSQMSRLSVIVNMESARDRAQRANAAEIRGNHQEAIRLWRIIFGNEFPQYG